VRTIEEVTSSMTALVDGAAGRSLTDDEVTQYEALEQELKGVQRSDAIRARNAAYNTIRTPAGVPSATPRPEDPTAGLRNYLLTGKANVDLQPSNAQSEGVPSQGGYLVPDTFRTKLVEKLKAFGGLASVADRYSTGTGNPVEWPTIDDTGNVGEIVSENGTFSAGADLTFGSNSLSAYTYATGGAGGPVKVPRELIQDSAFDVEGLIARLFATRIARIQAVHWISGTGVAQPLGLFTGRTPVQSAANTGITYEDLVTYIHSVDPAYRTNCRWLMNDLSLAEIEKIKDGSGSYIYRGRDANMAIGVNEATLLGYPITIDQAVPTLVKNSPTVQWGAFGNFSAGYVIRDVKDVEILVNPYSSMANRQIEISGWARADGTQQDTNAYITMTAHS
jgi:HK97 family phage major capsid protein